MTNFGAVVSASIIALGLLGSTAMGLHYSPYETCMRETVSGDARLPETALASKYGAMLVCRN